MSQTAANINNEENYLHLVVDNIDEAITINFPLAENFDTTLIVHNILFVKVAPFYYNDRVRLSFSIADEFKKHFILVKGIIEFNRAKDFTFDYNLSQRSIETDITVSQLEGLKAFFNNVSTWVKQEVQFKTALKIVLDFENRYKVEMAGVYNILNNTAAVAQRR